MTSYKTIPIARHLSENLALRDSARKLFKLVEELDEHDVVMDFAHTSSISRSFAHEYITQKKQSSKRIKEINVPLPVKKMFAAVNSPKNKPILRMTGLRTIKV